MSKEILGWLGPPQAPFWAGPSPRCSLLPTPRLPPRHHPLSPSSLQPLPYSQAQLLACPSPFPSPYPFPLLQQNQSVLSKVGPEHALCHPEARPGSRSLSINPKILRLSSRPAPPCHLCHLLSLPSPSPITTQSHRPPRHSTAPPWCPWSLSLLSGPTSPRLCPPRPSVGGNATCSGRVLTTLRPVFPTTWRRPGGVRRPPQSASLAPPRARHTLGADERAARERTAPRFCSRSRSRSPPHRAHAPGRAPVPPLSSGSASRGAELAPRPSRPGRQLPPSCRLSRDSGFACI